MEPETKKKRRTEYDDLNDEMEELFESVSIW